MNNDQFRKLVSGPGKEASPTDGSPPISGSPSSGSTLGSRQRSAIPMTPRSVNGAQASFARQMAERNQANRPQKRFKTSAPKGVRLGSGYVDRSKERTEEEADDREERLKALEKSYKDEEIDQETYERLRFQIAGGDLSSTHLVKGLDFKLLKRIKEGEDVYGEKKEDEAAPEEPEEDVDNEFDMLETQDSQTSDKPKVEKEKKKGQLSTVALAPGKKRTRDQILADLKAARKAAKEQQESALVNQGFKKIGAKQMPGTRIERDSKGREVMIIVDEDGHEKRKVRKVQPGEDKSELLMPDASARPLGMEVPEQYRKVEDPEEDEDVDIFDDIGDDYDPLAGMDDGSDDDSGDEQSARKQKIPKDNTKATTKDEADGAAMPPPPRPAQAAPRNYFSNSKTGLISEEAEKAPSMSDPAILAAIKKAAALNPIGKEDDDEGSSGDDERENEKALQERRKRLLAASNRDDDDLDMGFGTSRFEDEEDFEESKVKLSKWGGDGDDGDERSGGKGKRKRGAKKRKGDANNADDVLRVMEQRKKAS